MALCSSRVFLSENSHFNAITCAATERIAEVAFSADDKFVLATWDLGKVRLWETSTGVVTQTFSISDVLSSTALSSNGKYIAGGGIHAAYLWDIQTGALIRKFERESKDVYGTQVTFSPDGLRLLSGGFDGATLWDVSSGKQIYKFPGDMERAPIVSTDGRYLITYDSNENHYLWNIELGIRIFSFLGIAVFDAGRNALLLNNGEPSESYLLDLKTQAQTPFFEVQITPATQFSADGNYLLTDDGIDTIFIYNTTNGKLLQTNSTVQSLWTYKITLDSSRAILPSYKVENSSNKYIVLDLEKNVALREFDIGLHEVISSAISSDSNYWLTGLQSGEIKMWNLTTGDEVRQYC